MRFSYSFVGNIRGMTLFGRPKRGLQEHGNIDVR
jgi:hypothetical protein